MQITEFILAGRLDVQMELIRVKRVAHPEADNWQETAAAVAAGLPHGAIAVMATLNAPGPGGRVLMIVNDGDPSGCLGVVMMPGSAAGLIQELAGSIDCCARHLT